jgi:hypothetical protein
MQRNSAAASALSGLIAMIAPLDGPALVEKTIYGRRPISVKDDRREKSKTATILS